MLAALGGICTALDALAVWIGPYVASVVWLTGALLGAPARFTSLLAAGSLAWSVYLVHRWRRRRVGRERGARTAVRRWVGEHPGIALGALVISSALALWSLALVAPIAAALAPAGWTAVWLYAQPRLVAHRRVRETLILKNLAVGGAIAALCVGLVLLQGSGRSPADALWRGLRRADAWIVGSLLAALITADAAVSDIEDRRLDAQEGAATLPSLLGAVRTWSIAVAASACVGVALAGLGVAGAVAKAPAIALGIGAPASTMAVALAARRHPRRWIELRFVALAVLVGALQL